MPDQEPSIEPDMEDDEILEERSNLALRKALDQAHRQLLNTESLVLAGEFGALNMDKDKEP